MRTSTWTKPSSWRRRRSSVTSRIAGPSPAALPNGFALPSPTTTSRSLGASVSGSAPTLPAGFAMLGFLYFFWLWTSFFVALLVFQQLEIDYVIGESHKELLPNSSGPAAIIRIFGVTREGKLILFVFIFGCTKFLNWTLPNQLVNLLVSEE